MKAALVITACLVVAFVLLRSAAMEAHAEDKNKNDAATMSGEKTASHASHMDDEETMRFEGEKRYSANCGRCHERPHKLSPRIMATAIRHMRVRATLTDEDMRYILWYMTR